MDLPANHKEAVEAAYRAALESFNEGGVPVGSVLVIDDEIVAVGHNQRFQQTSNILHGEMDCIEKAGHDANFSQATLYTTLSPCTMCSGAVLLFKIPRLVILDDENVGDFETSERRLREKGVDVIIEPHGPSIELNRRFQTEHRSKWLGDVGDHNG